MLGGRMVQIARHVRAPRPAPPRLAIAKLAVVAAAASSLGASCEPSSPISLSTVVVTNHGKSFTDAAGVNGTYAWNQSDLGGVANESAINDTTSNFLLNGSAPRELYVFNFSGGAPGEVFRDLRFGAISAKGAASLSAVDFGIRAARLIDRGDCDTDLGFHPLHPISFFKMIDLQLAQSLEAAGKKKGLRTHAFTRTYAPSFIKHDGEPKWLNADGFALEVGWAYAKDDCWPDACRVKFRVRAAYKVETIGGVVTFSAVGDPEVSLEENAEMKVALFLKGIFDQLFALALLFPGESTHETLRNNFKYVLPRVLSESVRNQASQAIPTTSCTVGDPIEGDARCAAHFLGEGIITARDLIKVRVVTELVKAHPEWSPAERDAYATNLVASLGERSFFCAPVPQREGANCPTDLPGECRVAPLFKRVNVLPDRLSLVWKNSDDSEDPPSLQLVKLLAPTQAPVCGVHFGGTTGVGSSRPATRLSCEGTATVDSVNCPNDPCAPCSWNVRTLCSIQ